VSFGEETLKIAYFSPLNPIKSGVSDYSEELLEYLAGYAKIDLFIGDYRPTTAWLHDFFNIRNYREIYENHGKNDHDIHIYHIGNNDIHSYIYALSLQYPGIVVLHEPTLHHFIFSQTVGKNRLKDYLRELDYCYKEKRSEIVKFTLEERDESAWFKYSLVHRIVDSSLGIIVHSDFARSIIKSIDPSAKVKVVRHHYTPPPPNSIRPAWKVREILGFGAGDFVIGSMGYMTASKRLDLLLGVVSSLISKGYPVKVLLVGKMLPGCEVLNWVEILNLNNNVVISGYVDTKTFTEYLSVPDVFVALRDPSAGETSGSVVKMMGSGTPVIISDNYAFSEFPDGSCVKIPFDGAEEKRLEEALVSLIEDPSKRQQIGKMSREYILSHHDIHSSARAYMEFAVEILKG